MVTKRVLFLFLPFMLLACSSPDAAPAPPGALSVVITGLPQGAGANVMVSGPEGFSQAVSASTVIPNLRPGGYTVTAGPVTAGGVTYQPAPPSQSEQVVSNATATATVTYAENPAPTPPGPTPPGPTPPGPTPPGPTPPGPTPPGPTPPGPPPTVTAVTVTPSEASVAVGATTTLTATVQGTNNPPQTVTWASSDESIASVDGGGVVTGVAAGAATITARSTANSSVAGTATVTVTAAVQPPTVTAVTVTPERASLEVEATTSFTAEVTGTNDPPQTVTWTSSDESIATVDDGGVVTGVAAGEATITATSAFDPSVAGSAVVTVFPPAPTVTAVIVSPPTASIVAGTTTRLTATVQGENDPPQEVLWTSSDESIATVDDAGLVTGVAAGEVTIAATSPLDLLVSGSAVVIVTPAPTVTAVTVSPSSLTMGCNATSRLTATVVGEHNPPQTVTWTSSNESAATVDENGLVTTHHRGLAVFVTITATSTFNPSVSGSASVAVRGGTFGCL